MRIDDVVELIRDTTLAACDSTHIYMFIEKTLCVWNGECWNVVDEKITSDDLVVGFLRDMIALNKLRVERYLDSVDDCTLSYYDAVNAIKQSNRTAISVCGRYSMFYIDEELSCSGSNLSDCDVDTFMDDIVELEFLIVADEN